MGGFEGMRPCLLTHGLDDGANGGGGGTRQRGAGGEGRCRVSRGCVPPPPRRLTSGVPRPPAAGPTHLQPAHVFAFTVQEVPLALVAPGLRGQQLYQLGSAVHGRRAVMSLLLRAPEPRAPRLARCPCPCPAQVPRPQARGGASAGVPLAPRRRQLAADRSHLSISLQGAVTSAFATPALSAAVPDTHSPSSQLVGTPSEECGKLVRAESGALPLFGSVALGAHIGSYDGSSGSISELLGSRVAHQLRDRHCGIVGLYNYC